MSTLDPVTISERNTRAGERWFWIVTVAVVLLITLVSIGLSWRAALHEKEGDPIAELTHLASAAASAADAAKKAIEAEKLLDDKRIAEKAAEKTAVAHEAKAAKLKADNSNGAAEWENTAKGFRATADQCKQDRIDAESVVAKALIAVHAAREPLQPSLVATVSETFSPKAVEAIVLFLLLVSIFPASAFAFMNLEVPSLMELLKHDREMLGKISLSGTRDGKQIGSGWDWRSYLLHCCLAVFATAAGTALFFRTTDDLLDVNTLRGMQLGFLGAYVYSLYLVYRRYTTRDLMPHVYFYCALGMIVGIIINYISFAVITSVATSTPGQPEFTGIGAGGAAILAFSFGYFPNLAIRWFSRFTRTTVHDRLRRSDALPLSLIDGISELHESRLLDEGIDNVQNLATVDIADMAEKTPYTAKEIVEWVDQAILYLYVDPGEIDGLRKAGVRTVSDFRDIWGGLTIQYSLIDGKCECVPAGKIDPASDFAMRRKSIAQQLATTEERLDCLFRATSEGPNMEPIQAYWRNCRDADLAIRNRLVRQICGRVGLAVKDSLREGKPLTTDDLLQLVAEQLFLDTPQNNDVTPESLRGQAYLKSKLKLYADAKRLLEECVQLFPKDPAAFNDLAWLELNFLDSRRATFKSAHEHAQSAVDLAREHEDGNPNPYTNDIPPYLDTLALAAIRLGNPDKGVELVKEAIDKWGKLSMAPQPLFLETLMAAAEAYVSKGILARAQELLDIVKSTKYANAKTKKLCIKLQKEISTTATAASPPPITPAASTDSVDPV